MSAIFLQRLDALERRVAILETENEALKKTDAKVREMFNKSVSDKVAERVVGRMGGKAS